VIRPLGEADIAPLAARLAELPLLQRYGRGADGLERDLRAGLARGDQLLVHDPGGGAGALVWFLPSGTFGMGGYLRLLAVAPGGEGRGVGSELLRAFEEGAAGWSGHAFLLVSDFNSGAQRFYERHGYAQVGRLPSLVRPDIDELLYWRRLSRR
jgi:ribosomal protein S18 acetylase RimI-like enzyme